MPKGVFLLVLPHHVFLQLHWVLGSFCSLLLFLQRNVTLSAEGTPCLLEEMGLKHPDDALVHWLYQRRGVGREVDEVNVLAEVQQCLGVDRGVIKEHQDLEGEALTPAILLNPFASIGRTGMSNFSLLKSAGLHTGTSNEISMSKVSLYISRNMVSIFFLLWL